MFVLDIGSHHLGSKTRALEMAVTGILSGADAIKFQKRNVKLIESDETRDTILGNLTYQEYRKKLELSKKDYDYISKYLNEAGITWFFSVFDLDSAKFAYKYGNEYIKIPAKLSNDIELLTYCMDNFKTVIISVLNEDAMNNVLDMEAKECNLLFCHCVSNYPTESKDLDMKKITDYKEHNDIVGYSSHYDGIEDLSIAVALGAEYLEKHFTLNKLGIGTDNPFSLEPNEVEKASYLIKLTKEML